MNVTSTPRHLSPILRELVREAVGRLGAVIEEQAGKEAFRRVERLRKQMARLRGGEAGVGRQVAVLRGEFKRLSGLKARERHEVARAFTLMLELMNTCESAYRSHRIRSESVPRAKGRADSLIYVLTAHPTEARAPEFILVFREMTRILSDILNTSGSPNRHWDQLNHWLKVAWQTPIVRAQKPEVRDEAAHIYSALLRRETLSALLQAGVDLAPVYLRSWVGGDKDGHPGVDEKVFLESLALSRARILEFCAGSMRQIFRALQAMPQGELVEEWRKVREAFERLERLGPSDAVRAKAARAAVHRFAEVYEREVGAVHPKLLELQQLARVFPGWVVPIEFRESSDVLMAPAMKKRPIAMERMLGALAKVAEGGDPRWYVRGLIVSMTGELGHLQAAARLVKKQLGQVRLPIVPLFENAAALEASVQIVQQLLKDPLLSKALHEHWDGYLEVMVGYSDSSKENGVLPSRRMIAHAMHELDRLCRAKGVIPLFFQGSGGSVDRGGGTVAEQTAWWPSGALRNYKVTLQGEMVERGLATPEITRRQLERIALAAGGWKKAQTRRNRKVPGLDAFTERVQGHYRAAIHSPEFLQMVEGATPYPFLDALRIGSRPTKRATQLSVAGLRAIPWVLCWTQSRILFPTWWGVGAAWAEASPNERAQLKRAYRTDAVFATYVRALVFTLAKVQLPVWFFYLERSSLPANEIRMHQEQFAAELARAVEFARGVLGKQNLADWTPWLIESIALRSPMIHPLNLLQLLALQEGDSDLLRMTVTGVASGMMTTG